MPKKTRQDATLAVIHAHISSGSAPDTLHRNTIQEITVGLHDPEARDRAMSLIAPHELPHALALWTHAVRVGEQQGHRMYLAPLHTLRAWMLWIGDERQAAFRAIHSALAIDPGYLLGVLFHDLMAQGHTQPATVIEIVTKKRHLRPEKL